MNKLGIRTKQNLATMIGIEAQYLNLIAVEDIHSLITLFHAAGYIDNTCRINCNVIINTMIDDEIQCSEYYKNNNAPKYTSAPSEELLRDLQNLANSLR